MSALSVEDRLDLVDLVHRYAARVDDRDAAGVGALFTDDGVLASPAPPRSLDPVHESVGPDGVAATMGQLAAIPLTVHTIVGHVVDALSADEATGRTTCVAHHVTERDGRPVDLVWHVRYLDAYRRTASGWRFARRDLHVDVVESRPVSAARGIARPAP
ncbi:nuclear transport factor 2 family protein [Nocardioides pacificus]